MALEVTKHCARTRPLLGLPAHAAVVVRDRITDVPYLLEGDASGVTLRTYEERLMQVSASVSVFLPAHATPAQPTG